MISHPSDSFEQQAEATARAVMAGPAPPARRVGSMPGMAARSAAPSTVWVQRDVGTDPGRQAGQAGSADTGPSPTPADTTQSCAGWESDPQSLSIKAAQNFFADAFGKSLGSAETVSKAGNEWLVKFIDNGPITTIFVLVDLSQGPGKVSVYGNYPPFGRRQCSYSYTCSTAGGVTFKRIAC